MHWSLVLDALLLLRASAGPEDKSRNGCYEDKEWHENAVIFVYFHKRPKVSVCNADSPCEASETLSLRRLRTN